MVLADEFSFLDVIWSMILFGLFFMWIWIVITTFADIFRRDDISGWSKALWSIFIIFLPFLGVFLYLITRPKMTEQDQRIMEQYEAQQRRMAGYSPAEEIAKLTELRNSGAITAEEFEELKRKAM
jgi:type VI protein secretion system component VasK